MKKYVFIGAGSFTGAILRVLIKNMHIFDFLTLPVDTMIINILGVFILSFFVTLTFETLDSDFITGITVGLLGAFTTFSTLCKDSVSMLNTGNHLFAGIYICVSIVLGIGAAYLGTMFARLLNYKSIKHKIAANEVLDLKIREEK